MECEAVYSFEGLHALRLTDRMFVVALLLADRLKIATFFFLLALSHRLLHSI